MRYAYKDLGQQPAGSTAIVRWRGSAANVILLDPVNFSKYRDGRPFFYADGGHYGRPPARITIPEDGRWYVVVDLRRYAGSAPTVKVLRPRDAQPRAGHRPKAELQA